MIRRYPRLARAAKFFELSLALFVIALFTWIYTKLMDVYFTTPLLVWFEYWLGYLTLGAVFFWVVSRVNPIMWKNIAGMLGWKEEHEARKR